MGNGLQQEKYDDEWLARPIGLGLPTKRASAFKALQASTAPTANPYLAAEQHQQSSYRSAAAADATGAVQFPVPIPADPDPQTATVAADLPAYSAPEQIGVSTHRNDLPTQRTEEHSVPSVGPNPFLAAARIQQAGDEVNAL